jgi:uroporphyrinogen decarboxylase
MRTNIFDNRAKNQNNQYQLPIWFMRQAGRYHNHYQKIKANSDFMTMCKDPKLAAEITMGPIEDFNFDAAILFSDLLFPLEQLGMGLSYKSGPPTLNFHLNDAQNLNLLTIPEKINDFYGFQTEALKILKEKLPSTKTLLGFVGAPWTLYTYACDGGHNGGLIQAKNGLFDGRWDFFSQVIIEILENNIQAQVQGGADAICLFDTAAGELSPNLFARYHAPIIEKLMQKIKNNHPNLPIIYYAKFITPDHLSHLPYDLFKVLGIDWRFDLKTLRKIIPSHIYLQGNMDPALLHMPWSTLEKELVQLEQSMKNADFDFSKWIFGLGHGVTINTPEINVKNTVKFVHDNFLYL